MSSYKETKEKIYGIVSFLKEKTPQNWHERIKKTVEESAEKDEFFLIRDSETLKMDFYEAILRMSFMT